MVRRWVALVTFAATAAGLAHCGDDEPKPDDPIGLPGRDAEAGGDAILADTDGATGGLACDPNTPFGTPTPLSGLDQVAYASTPRLSGDELAIYFTWRLERDGGGYDGELGRASRSSLDASFGDAQTLKLQGSPDQDKDPSVSADHLSLWFHSSRVDGQNDLYFATRASDNDEFGAPASVPNVNTLEGEAHAYYRLAGGELWFASQRDGGTSYDVYVAKRQSIGFAGVTFVSELSSTFEDWHPTPREDGLAILISSDRDGGAGGFDLWMAQRASIDLPFDAPQPIRELNSASADHAGWLSPDGCRIYFSSDRDSPGVHRLWMAERPKR